jgi:hypothetical protein
MIMNTIGKNGSKNKTIIFMTNHQTRTDVDVGKTMLNIIILKQEVIQIISTF